MATHQTILVTLLLGTLCVVPSLQDCDQPIVQPPVKMAPNRTSYIAWEMVTFSCPPGYQKSSTGYDYSYCFTGPPDYWYPPITTVINCVPVPATTSAPTMTDSTALPELAVLFVADGDGEIQMSDASVGLNFRQIISTTGTPVAVDYHADSSTVYWTESDGYGSGSIVRAKVDGTNRQVVAQTNVGASDGIVVDSVQNKVYWSDTGNNVIESANFDGSGRQVVINTGLDEPRAMLIHPDTRQLYWTDWGHSAKIERANLDGSNRQVIVQENITWPNGIAFSSDGNQLYWGDSFLNRIESIDLSGSNRRIVLEDSTIRPFDLIVEGSKIVWTDWNYKALGYSDDDGATYSIITQNYFYRPMGIHFHQDIVTTTAPPDTTTTAGYPQTTTTIVTPSVESHLVCEDTSMTLFLARSLLENHGVASDVHFEDQSCVGYDHDNERIAITTRYDRCSTKQNQTADNIVFTNIVTYFKPSSVNGSVITRDFRLHIPVTCLLKRDKLLGSSYKPKTGVNVFPEEGYGTFNMSLDRFADDEFRQTADQTAIVFLGEPLYFGVNLAAVTDLTLLILNCWATPTIYDLGQPQYHFIEEGCAKDPTVNFYDNLGNPMFKGFDVDAFTFIGEYDEVFIHCEVIVCDNADPGSTCAQGCVSRSKRSAASPGSRSKPHTISNGPLASRSSDGQSGDSSDDSWLTNPIKMATIGAAGFVLAIVGVVMYMKIGRRHESRGYRRVDQEGLELMEE